MVDVALINPNNRIMSPFAGIEPPLWLGCVATHYRDKGNSVAVLDAEAMDWSASETAQRVRELKPRKVIIVVMGNNPSVSSTPKMIATKKLVDYLIGEMPIAVTGLHPSALPKQTRDELGIEVLRGKIFQGTPDMPWELLPMDKYIAHSWHCLDGSPRKPYAVTFSSLGCSFNCEFCLPPNTKVLTSDLIWENIQDIKIGDRLIGVEEDRGKNSYIHQYCETVVLATSKRDSQTVYEIKTDDGSVYSTEEHPWLMAKGRWKSISDIKKQYIHNASFTSTRSMLRKVSEPVDFLETSDYRKGYLAGVAIGDGSFQSQKNIRGNKYSLHFRLVGDIEMYDVFIRYAKLEGIEAHIGNYKCSPPYKRLHSGVYVTKNACAKKLAAFVNEERNTKDYMRGFLAGIYDSEGSFSQSVLRIANRNVLLNFRVIGYLQSLGFNSVMEKQGVRILGGFGEYLKFFALVHPNVIHKKNILSYKLRGKAKVISASKYKKMDVYNLKTSCGNFIADGFVTHNCNIHALYGNIRRVWYREVDAVVNEIDILVNKYGVRNIKMWDELFTLNKERVNLICDKLIERKYDLNIWAYARVDTVEPKMLAKLKRAGINWLAFGLESGNDYVLGEVNKKANRAEAIKAVEMTHNAGINVGANFIFGLEGDTLETMRETLDFAKSLNAEWGNFYFQECLPGSPLWDKRAEKEKDWGKFGQFSQTPKMSEALEFRDKAFNEYFASPEYINNIRKKFGEQAVQHIEDMLKFGKPVTRN